jgi:gliding motility-associated-like protein
LPGQTNLVPNPSFEDTISCPMGPFSPWSLAAWFNASNSSPDYYNICDLNNGAGVPENDWGFQFAQDGNAYVGLATYCDDSLAPPDYREYYGIQLNSILEAGKTYYWCMWISLLNETDLASNNMGIGLSNSMQTFPFPFPSTVIPIPCYGSTSIVILDTLNWTKIGGSFTATGGENYLYIGNFFNDSQTQLIQWRTNSINGGCAYYYVDNIYLGETACFKSEFIVPNVFSPNNDGINDFFYCEGIGVSEVSIVIYNRWGVAIHELINGDIWDGTINGAPCNEGIYYWAASYFNAEENKTEKTSGFMHLMR